MTDTRENQQHRSTVLEGKKRHPQEPGLRGYPELFLWGTCGDQGNRVQLGPAPAGAKTYSQSMRWSDS